uniref:Uncharacterized protein n=1 Tax=Alexandrium monilatum TaxID=311494 RepID=A0A7S4V7U1_9DINO
MGGAGLVLLIAVGRIRRETGSAVSAALGDLFPRRGWQRLASQGPIEAVVQMLVSIILLAVVVPIMIVVVIYGWMLWAAASAALVSLVLSALPLSSGGLVKARLVFQVCLQYAGALWLLLFLATPGSKAAAACGLG